MLCANKSDLASVDDAAQVIEDEMLPLMAEFKVGANQHEGLCECSYSNGIGDRLVHTNQRKKFPQYN